jgi:hypothetical protein
MEYIQYVCQLINQESAVGTVSVLLAKGLRNRGSIADRGKRLSPVFNSPLYGPSGTFSRG